MKLKSKPAAATATVTHEGEPIAAWYRRVRRFSEQIARRLEPEDCVIQSMPDVSPTRWHLAHTTWFYETFLLRPSTGAAAYNEAYETLFNSYYNSVGEQFPRHRRGLLSRPTVREVLEYRDYVDELMLRWLEDDDLPLEQRELVVLGLHHEQQHQELMLTDIKHVFSCNPIYPALQPNAVRRHVASSNTGWSDFDGGVIEIGFDGDCFAYDNESPRHRVLLEPFSLSNALVTAGDYLQFIEDGGYAEPGHWLSMGWAAVQENGWTAPLYWQMRDGQWHHYTLGGLEPVRLNEPVCHLSYLEADAFARWAGYRLPTEAEWEHAFGMSQTQSASDGDADRVGPQWADQRIETDQLVHPSSSVSSEDAPSQMMGEVWEWTASPYTPYPGYAPPEGAIGEYNGKFMCNQYVLRGGSCATPDGHIRATYRNFFSPDTRWQFSGLRLAK